MCYFCLLIAKSLFFFCIFTHFWTCLKSGTILVASVFPSFLLFYEFIIYINSRSTQNLAVPTAHAQINGINGTGSDSDSWVESSRSRDTSPESSIPPGMPPFRVIPLCESESSGTHMSDPNNAPLPGSTGFLRNSSNMGSDLGSNPGYGGIYPRSSSEAGSIPNSDNWNEGLPRQNGVQNGTGAGQPMLRRNQYWV